MGQYRVQEYQCIMPNVSQYHNTSLLKTIRHLLCLKTMIPTYYHSDIRLYLISFPTKNGILKYFIHTHEYVLIVTHQYIDISMH